MFGLPAGYSSEEDDDYDYYKSESFSTPTSPVNLKPSSQTNEQQFYRACIGGNFEFVSEFLETNPDFDVNHKFHDDSTPLLLSASTGAVKVVRLLLDKGADVNYHQDGYSPLMAVSSCPKETSSYEDSFAVAKMLLDSGCDPNAIDRKRRTALMCASTAGNCLIVVELLKWDIDREAEDNQGWTALFWAVNANRPEIVKLLLNEGFSCDRMDVRGDTPMLCAARNGFDQIVDLLPSAASQSCEAVLWENDKCFEDFFREGSLSFANDVCGILYGTGSENSIGKFLSNRVSLFDFLRINEDGLKSLGVDMPYERYRILDGLFRFHKQPFLLKSIRFVQKSEPMSLADVGTSMLTAGRQFIAMKASLRYLIDNVDSKDFNQYKSQIKKLQEKLRKIEGVLSKLNERCVNWDRENKPSDLITKQSLQRIKRSFKKTIASVTFASVVFYFGIKICRNYFFK